MDEEYADAVELWIKSEDWRWFFQTAQVRL